MATVERALSLEEAEKRVRQTIRDFGLSPHLEEHGRNGDGPTAWSCDLIRPDGVMASKGSGFGKGNRIASRVGALFEALEHLLDGPGYFNADEVFLRPSNSFTGTALSAEASIAILATTPERELACRRYTSLQSKEQIDVPLYLSSPWYLEDSARGVRDMVGDLFNYRELARYSTNSGCAIGATDNEATLHAVNEVIERDAISLLLARSFLGDEPPTLVKEDTLPEELANLLSYVESQLGSRVYLVDMTTEVDVPAYMAYTLPTVDRTQLHGAGASLSPRCAAYRAISELLQCHLLRNNTELSTEDLIVRLEPLRKYPSLYRCGFFDLTDLLPQARLVAFEDRLIPDGLDAHLIELSRRVYAKGFSIYQRRIHSLSNGINTVHVIIPGMEHFMTITNGIVIAPGDRGIQAVRK